jgi:hypothetical protein
MPPITLLVAALSEWWLARARWITRMPGGATSPTRPLDDGTHPQGRATVVLTSIR